MFEHTPVKLQDDAPDDASWRMWSEDDFWLALWLTETTAAVICRIPADADRDLRRKAARLAAVVRAHQGLRDQRGRVGCALHHDARLILSRERVATRLDALHARGHRIRFRPSAAISAIELSLDPVAR